MTALAQNHALAQSSLNKNQGNFFQIPQAQPMGNQFSHAGNPGQQWQSNQQKDQEYQQQLQQQVQNQQAADKDLEDDPNDNDIIGVIKIKDGLFICDELGAQDLEFVVANKVTRVINCAGTQLRNFWEAIGVLYLTLNWQDDEKQTLFDAAEKIPEEIYRFMEEAVENHESVLVQSVRAQNRACFVIAAFIMRRYRWSLLKTLEFLNSRRPDLEMRPSFLAQLQQYENRLYAKGIGPKTKRWNELSDTSVPELENEELILRNTYMNSQQGPIVDLSLVPSDIQKVSKLVWRDQKSSNSQDLCEENRDCDDLINLTAPNRVTIHHRTPATQLPSKIKTSKLYQSQKRSQMMGQGPGFGQPALQQRDRPNSQNSKQKFLTKTAQNVSSDNSSEKENPKSSAIPKSAYIKPQDAPQPANQPPPQPLSSSGQQTQQNTVQMSMFHPPQSTQMPKTALQQKLLGQRNIQSHQVRDISPLNSNYRNKQILGQNTSVQNRAAQSGPGSYVPFEPKKRDMTAKIAPKMPASYATTNENNIPGSHSANRPNQSTTPTGAQKIHDKRNNSMQIQSNEPPLQTQVLHNRPGSGKNAHQNSKSIGGGRGISPSFQSKTSDLSAKNRGTLNSSYKRAIQTAHPPVHPSYHDGLMQPVKSASQRPGSAPKMRNQTPNGETQASNANSSLILKSQPSTNSTSAALNTSTSNSKPEPNHSKNIMNSFRNGPVKQGRNFQIQINHFLQSDGGTIRCRPCLEATNHAYPYYPIDHPLKYLNAPSDQRTFQPVLQAMAFIACEYLDDLDETENQTSF